MFKNLKNGLSCVSELEKSSWKSGFLQWKWQEYLHLVNSYFIPFPYTWKSWQTLFILDWV